MTPLEIQIKTVADLHGANLTVDAMQRVKEATQQAASKGNAYVEAHSKVTDEMKSQAAEQVRLMTASGASAAATATLTKNVGTLRTTFEGLRGVIGGAVQGDLGRVASGFGKITSAVTNASPALQSFFGQVGRALSAAGAIAGPALVGIDYMKQKTRDLLAEMAKFHADTAANRAASAARQVAASELIVAAYKKEAAALDEITAAIKRRDDQIEQSRNRADTLAPEQRKLRDQKVDTDEKAALAKARTPEARAKVTADFAGRRQRNKITDDLGDLGRTAGRADQDIGRDQADIHAAQERNRGLDADVRNAEAEFELAREATRAFKPTDNSKQAQAARKAALDARANLDQVKGSTDTARADNNKVIEAAVQQIQAAQLTKEVTALQVEYYRNALAQQGKEAPGSKKIIEAAVKAVDGEKGPERGAIGIRGTITTKDGQEITVRSGETVAGLKKVADNFTTMADLTASLAEKSSRDIERTKKKIKLAQQAGPGGGG